MSSLARNSLLYFGNRGKRLDLAGYVTSARVHYESSHFVIEGCGLGNVWPF